MPSNSNKTDKDGKCRIEGLGEGKYLLKTSKKYYNDDQVPVNTSTDQHDADNVIKKELTIVRPKFNIECEIYIGEKKGDPTPIFDGLTLHFDGYNGGGSFDSEPIKDGKVTVYDKYADRYDTELKIPEGDPRGEDYENYLDAFENVGKEKNIIKIERKKTEKDLVVNVSHGSYTTRHDTGGVTVGLFKQDGEVTPIVSATTDSKGQCALKNITPGNYQLRVYHDNIIDTVKDGYVKKDITIGIDDISKTESVDLYNWQLVTFKWDKIDSREKLEILQQKQGKTMDTLYKIDIGPDLKDYKLGVLLPTEQVLGYSAKVTATGKDDWEQNFTLNGFDMTLPVVKSVDLDFYVHSDGEIELPLQWATFKEFRVEGYGNQIDYSGNYVKQDPNNKGHYLVKNVLPLKYMIRIYHGETKEDYIDKNFEVTENMKQPIDIKMIHN